MKSMTNLLLIVSLLFVSPRLWAGEQVSRPFVGVTHRQIVRDDPRPLVINLVEIDLTAPGIRFRLTPSNGDPNGDEPGDPNHETTRQTTLAFLIEQEAQVAINASFFTFIEDTMDTNDVALLVSDGERISPFDRRWPALNITRDNRASVVRHAGDEPAGFDTAPPGVELYNAVSGSNQIVSDGQASVFRDDDFSRSKFVTDQHPRTAVGITADQRLLLVTVDGRQPGLSEGVSLAELAELLIDYGAVDAINLDGGGSTTMVFADPEPRVINFPSDKDAAGEPGKLRSNGSNLAVFAQPNPDYAPLPRPPRP